MPRRPSRDRKAARSAASYWLDQVEKGLAYLERLKLVPSLSGEVWQKKTLAHFKGRLEVLLAQPPAGSQGAVKAFRKRLKAL